MTSAYVFTVGRDATFTVRNRGTVVIVDKNDLAVPLNKGDEVELRRGATTVRTVVAQVEVMHGPPPPRQVLGVMFSPGIVPEQCAQGTEVWRRSEQGTSESCPG
jgi:hypothetical protein